MLTFIKIKLTSENQEIIRNKNKNKKAYQELLDSCYHYTTDEWLRDHNSIKDVEWVIEGDAETLVEEVIKFKFNERCNEYKMLNEKFPEDLNEDRTDWNSLRNMADDMYYFIDRLYSYID